MSRKLLSELFKGAWSNATAYTIGDIVENDGSSYACIVANTNQEPPNATYWALLAEKGDDGSQGIQGTKGIAWQGQWVAGTYNADDAVLYQGSAYISTALTTGEPTISADWELLARRGLYWKGDWSAGTYNENDAVYNDGSSYVATTETTEEPSGTATDWDILAISGEVLGDTSSTDENIAVFDGITGKKIKDGGKTIAEVEASAIVVSSPVGSITAYAGATAPAGWLLCQGQAISRATYSSLFDIVGETYGVGDGSTTFNIPDIRGRVPVGKSADTEFDTLGETGGAKTHTLEITEIPAHTHTQISSLPGVAAGGGEIAPGQSGSNTGSTGGGQAHNNLQPYITLNYIIKT